MQCIEDRSQLKFAGSIKRMYGIGLVVNIKPCSGSNCKSEEEVDQFWNDHMLMVVMNDHYY